MKRLLRTISMMAAVLALLWGAGNLLLEVQLPTAPEGRGAFPDPMDPEMNLSDVFLALPAANGSEQSRVALLDDNATAWLTRWRLLAEARQSIDVSYFILKQDVFGAALLGHLIKKAREGVRIRVLLDAMGTEMSRDRRGNGYLGVLVRTPGVQVRVYRPLKYRYLDAFLTLNPAAVIASDHDKILVVDGRRALTGGRNISREYFSPPADDPTAFHDTDVLLAGRQIAAAMTTAFEAQFTSGEAKPMQSGALHLDGSEDDLLEAYQLMDEWLRGLGLPDRTADIEQTWAHQLQGMPGLHGILDSESPGYESTRVRLLNSRTRLINPNDAITRSLIRLIRSAREEIFIQSPYLVLLKDAAELLEEAAERGVRITILTNGPAARDRAIGQAFFFDQWPRLLQRIPSLQLYVGGDRHNLHSKIAVVDRRVSLVGTYNFDPLSMLVNSELVIVADSEALAERVLEKPERLMAAGPPRTYRYLLAPAGDQTDAPAMIEFGPTDHWQAKQWPAVAAYQYWLIKPLRVLDTPLL
ncbi:phospholipase D-like domain-containing protein [Thiohalomonas denitrificans]|uniref:Phosphatidylserine/phosphatidylglycerophosphate/cardiolipin synthase n=1 Tax=Thiohalomonas denitrificans TaxID=415747 RepID=A0A1G5QY85_9GAMM|nr:phosphatidylserine/phosphatidylglycerophosphate/cardiolipin synthase family protein [Thiohalomonas denitrificans]SCZ66676.1 Phosphatidylserine/phosphatidylglycerophosphate/cardiolipin synthase [Thiohalomonas denitrificans]